MKENVLILSKTQMSDNKVCVGGLTLNGRYVRLLDREGNNQPQNTDLAPRQAWEIEFKERLNIVPPHVEDVLVQNRISKGLLKGDVTIKSFIKNKNIPIWQGPPDALFNRLIKWTQNGRGYIDHEGGIPNHSVGFWLSDKDLERDDFNGIRYHYPCLNGRRSLKFKGTENPVNTLPAGTLLRVSLARWIAFAEGETPKCWLQLSGWYDLGEQPQREDGLPF